VLPDVHDGAVLGVKITNPDKTLFPDSPDFTKLEFARYYAAIAPLMLPEVGGRLLTLLR
jgi:DNA primase